MSYTIPSLSYDTDLSRTDARTIMANITKVQTEAIDDDVPTKTVFEDPEIIDEDENLFAFPVRPTVTDAGFEPEDLVWSCNYNGYNLRVRGMAKGEGRDRDTLHVRLSEGESHNAMDIDDVVEARAN